jgi:hypothetical protein
MEPEQQQSEDEAYLMDLSQQIFNWCCFQTKPSVTVSDVKGHYPKVHPSSIQMVFDLLETEEKLSKSPSSTSRIVLYDVHREKCETADLECDLYEWSEEEEEEAEAKKGEGEGEGENVKPKSNAKKSPSKKRPVDRSNKVKDKDKDKDKDGKGNKEGQPKKRIKKLKELGGDAELDLAEIERRMAAAKDLLIAKAAARAAVETEQGRYYGYVRRYKAEKGDHEDVWCLSAFRVFTLGQEPEEAQTSDFEAALRFLEDNNKLMVDEESDQIFLVS